MDTRLIEYFVAVADERSVTRASQRLYAAQSTVSAGLRSLERDLGVRLLSRTTRSVELTSEGRDLLPLAREVLEGLELLRSTAAESAGGLHGRITMGTFTAMHLMDLPAVLGRFRDRYPRVDILLTASPTGSTGLTGDVLHGRLDLAFTALVPPAELETWPLASVPFIALVPPDSALAQQRDCTLTDLANQPWVEVLPGFGNRVQVERLLAERGLARRIAVEVADLPSAPRFVAQGFGVAVIPDSIPTPGCMRLPLRDVHEQWTLRLMARPGARNRPQLRALIDALTEGQGHPPAQAGSADPSTARPPGPGTAVGAADTDGADAGAKGARR